MFSIFPLAFLCEQLLFCGIFLYGKPQAKESAKHTCNWPRQSPEPDSPEKLYANDATFYPVKYQWWILCRIISRFEYIVFGAVKKKVMVTSEPL